MNDHFAARAIHFIGIGGAGMSALARMALVRGARVSGSDIRPSALTDALKEKGARVSIGHDMKNIPADADRVVYTLALDEKNPELANARKRGLRIFTYAEFLGAVSRDFYTIAISGTHGKTSTTGMTARVFHDAGLDPSVIVGGVMRDFGSNCVVGGERSGGKNFFIAEACEYERSFLNLHPRILAVTNIDNDHLDYYADIAEIQGAFRELAERLGPDDFLVCDPNDLASYPVAEGLRCRIVDFSPYIYIGLKLQVPGSHMIRNAAIALAIADSAGIDPVQARSALERYSGIARRFEYKGAARRGAAVYDDYAHHPTEIRATLKAARERFPDKKIHVVFQPHLYSRTRLLFRDFAGSFADADEAIFVPIYAAREAADPNVSSEALAREAANVHPNAVFCGSIEEAFSRFENADASDVIFTMGAGDVYRVADQLVAAAQV